MSSDTTLDVRDSEDEPFTRIAAALSDLDRDETLELVNSFEPEPLYDVLLSRGFEYETEQVADDQWRVRITRD
ncbi:DUF2249 domain-containing protein [Haloarcula amylovorans]|uniref:DUF2249 domain-containing protein n=1 Tax=Haloarcula amylovorans TaxID=2562280 RepID=UPI00107616AE|nr:DUF2249 domain-containing protein [Halomicroarcula amylolytica]